MRRRVTTLFCCFAACLALLSGCISVIDAAPHSGSKSSKADNVNLLVKIDIEKNGVLLDSISSIASKDSITISDSCQEKQGSDIDNVILSFSGKNIKKVSEDSYSMDYNIEMRIPVKNKGYTSLGSFSSINVKSGQTVCIYENNVYKVKMTITVQK